MSFGREGRKDGHKEGKKKGERERRRDGNERRNELSNCRQVISNFTTVLSSVLISDFFLIPELGLYRRNIMNHG